MYIFIAGMTRSGKSEYAEKRAVELGRDASSLVYIAASEVYDAEMMRRVELHRARRAGMGFMTIERTHDLGELMLPEDACVLIESLSVWLANEMFTGSGVNNDAGEKVYQDFMRLRRRVKHVVLVSDDVFSDGGGYDELTKEYVRTLGGLHVRLAAVADEVYEIVSGIAVRYSADAGRALC
ncbi:MAG: bifunctional adenosylcobinamide kinase/adenosylcobinamide-phosphate guanylyltransferase [Synergistaceae bacterium]|nr:bifunctional adenosylcobinamide kinase/adenosylcobinamide-phosphate guanylyltransferase [Synergistaceae bacterium]